MRSRGGDVVGCAAPFPRVGWVVLWARLVLKLMVGLQV
jgi:hypothetical protein